MLRQQREGSGLREQRCGMRRIVALDVRQEVAAVPAGLEPLRDHRIGAVILEPARLGNGRRRRDDLRAPSPRPGQQLIRRQPEMEAHDAGHPRRGVALDEFGDRMAERRAPTAAARPGRRRARLDRVRATRASAASAAASATGSRWQKKLRFHGRPSRASPPVPDCSRSGDSIALGNDPSATGFADRNRQAAALHARHRRLDQRQFGAKQRVCRRHGDLAGVSIPSLTQSDQLRQADSERDQKCALAKPVVTRSLGGTEGPRNPDRHPLRGPRALRAPCRRLSADVSS